MSLRNLKGCCTATLSAAPSSLPCLLARGGEESACVSCSSCTGPHQLDHCSHLNLHTRSGICPLLRLTVVRGLRQRAAGRLTPLSHIGRCCCRGCVLPWRYEKASLAVELAR